jgi:hypothetical protein
MRDRLIELIQSSVGGCARHWAEVIADHLLAAGCILPPIGLGRTCFDVSAKCVDECRVSSVTQKADGSLKVRITNLRYRAAYEITPDEIGKTVFLTREEAARALAERREG